MKKFLFLLLFINCSFLFGENLPLRISPFVSYNNDTITYSIYDGPKLNSQLDWETPYLFKTGLKFSFDFNNLILDFSNAAAIPVKCGTMYDSDWYTENIKTNLSKHNLHAGFCYDLDITLKYRFELENLFSILPLISFNYSHSSLKAQKGIGWCGDTGHTQLIKDYPWDSEYAVKVNKFGIDFYNNTFIFFIGAGLEKSLGSLQFGINAQVSPYIYVSSIDHHLNDGDGRYYLLLQSAWFSCFNLELPCSYMINDKNKLCIIPKYSYCKEIKGVFYSGKEKVRSNRSDQPCSFNFSKFALCIAWEINI